MKKEIQKQNIVIYRDKQGNVELQADIKKETIWATQAQIVKLFDVDQSVVSRHIRNILKDREVDGKSNMQKMHIANSDKPTILYSLDLILAVGYRTNSARAIMFRRWATKTLKDYILKGAAFNADRLKKLPQEMIKDLNEKITFIQKTIYSRQLNQDEIGGLLSVIKTYASSWSLLKKYDEGDLVLQKGRGREKKYFDYAFVAPAIKELKINLIKKGEASELFGNEREGAFQGIIKTIYQTFGGKELYSSLEEKAAHLLYFIIKDHPFTDGNKRIASFLFVLFLNANSMLYRPNGEKKINDNTLVALALLVAESDAKDKDVMVALITNLITDVRTIKQN